MAPKPKPAAVLKSLMRNPDEIQVSHDGAADRWATDGFAALRLSGHRVPDEHGIAAALADSEDGLYAASATAIKATVGRWRSIDLDNDRSLRYDEIPVRGPWMLWHSERLIECWYTSYGVQWFDNAMIEGWQKHYPGARYFVAGWGMPLQVAMKDGDGWMYELGYVMPVHGVRVPSIPNKLMAASLEPGYRRQVETVEVKEYL